MKPNLQSQLRLILSTVLAMSILGSTFNASGQGLVTFANLVVGVVDAPVSFADGPNVGKGVGAGTGYRAQLFGGADLNSLTALNPSTTFRKSDAGFAHSVEYYVNGTVVAVPGIAPGNKATLVMRVFNSSNSLVGESEPITTTLGGGITPPAYLGGLQAFTVIVFPENDNFADRIPLHLFPLPHPSLVVEGSNAHATKEVGEPDHGGHQATASIWWSWTPPKYGNVTISTSGSAIDTLLAVYTGGSLDTLKQVAVNDDDPGGGTTSRVTFVTPVAPGTEYSIAVDSLGGVAGNIRLNIDFTPVGPPLRLAVSGSNLILSWPAIAPGFGVETTEDLSALNWTSVLLTPVIVGEAYSAKLPISSVSKFYRLRGQ